jgi:hypothetical protein
MTRGRVAWTIATLDVVAFMAATLAAPFDASSLIYLVGIASFAGVGALLIGRVPANPIGALLLAAGTTLVAAIVVGTYADIGMRQAPPWPAATFARRLGDVAFFYPFLIAVIGIPLVFPDGRLPSQRYRWAAAATIMTAVAWTAGGMLAAPLDGIVLVSTLVAFAGAVAAIWRRYRVGDEIQRHQVKWLVADVFVAIGALLPSLFLTESHPALADVFSSIAIIAMLLLPVVIGIAILRYRLYEIDRIVSRGISYAIVTGLLVAVFGVVVITLSTVLSELAQGPSIAVAASTLAVFAIVQPVVRRVRHAVDRRFDRSRYDAARIAATFSQRLRNEVDMEAVTGDLARTAGTAVAPKTLTIWLRPRTAR